MFPRISSSRIEVMMLYRVGVGVLLEESAEEVTQGTECDLNLNLPIQSSLQTIPLELAHRTMNPAGELFLKVKKETMEASTFIL